MMNNALQSRSHVDARHTESVIVIPQHRRQLPVEIFERGFREGWTFFANPFENQDSGKPSESEA